MNSPTLKPLAILIAGLAGSAHAAGFALIEQSASGLGNAFAGASAVSDDASYQYFNPASISFLSGSQISGALHIISPDTSLSGASARVVTLGNIPYSGGSGGDAGVTGYVPNLYYVRDHTGSLKFGLGVNAPFGLATEYDRDWIGRYHAVESDMKTININPVLSYKHSSQLSFAAGLSAQYIDAKLTSSIDSSSICLGLQASHIIPGGTCTAFGLNVPGNSSVDSYVKNEGDNWGYGYNLGLIWKPAPATTLGLSYRSEVDHELSGKANFTRSAQMNALLSLNPALNALLVDTHIKADTTLPASASLSLAQDLNQDLTLLADLTWTGWSSFDKLVINFSNPAQADGVTTENWQDTWRYSLGANWRLNPALKLRAGVAYDQTPVKSATWRTPRIPDNNRTWLALGATYAAGKQLSLDFGYAHLFVDDVRINNTTEGTIAHNLTGTYESSVDIFSMQGNWKF
jgi:long-chain fatty acid transport protein